MKHQKRTPGRIGISLLMTVFMSLAVFAYAAPAEEIRLPDTNLTVGAALQMLEIQSGKSLVANLDYLDLNKEISPLQTRGTVEEITKAIVEPLGLRYRITDSRIIILPPQKEERVAATSIQPVFNTPGIPDYNLTQQERVSFVGEYEVLSVNVDSGRGEKADPESIQLEPYTTVVPQTEHVSKVALKTNFLYGATLTPNLGVEFVLGKKSTMDISAGYNFYKSSKDKMWKHWLVQPEYRYWFCERFNGWFIGGHLLGGQFNFSKIDFPFNVLPDLKDYRYEGEYYGAGVVGGHQWILGKRLSLETVLGLGYVRVEYDKFPCSTCGPAMKSGGKNYFGPTKIAVSLLFFL